MHDRIRPHEMPSEVVAGHVGVDEAKRGMMPIAEEGFAPEEEMIEHRHRIAAS